jgi:hypothetical protein
MEKKIRELIEKYDIKIREENLYHTPLWDFIQDLEWLLEEESWEDIAEKIINEYIQRQEWCREFCESDMRDILIKHLVK